MADTYYAWSPIRYTKGEGDNAKTETIKFGEKVSAGDIGVDEENWNELVASGAVRTMPAPELPEGYGNSPVEYLREQAVKAEGVDVIMPGGSYFGPSQEEMLTAQLESAGNSEEKGKETAPSGAQAKSAQSK